MPRFLILHASVGAGHRSAADALAAVCRTRPDTDVRVEDVLEFGNPVFRQAYTGAYLDLTNRAPRLWQRVYEQSDVADPELADRLNRLRGLVERLGVNALLDLVRDYRPDVVICTHFLPAELLSSRKGRGRFPQPLYTVMTDFSPHATWIDTAIDGYFVATDLTRSLLVQRGIDASIVHVTGIPIRADAARPKQANVIRQRLGLRQDVPLVVLFGGGIHPERVLQVAEPLLAGTTPLTLVAVAGRNEALTDTLAHLNDGPHARFHLLGMIDYVDDLLVASDLIITKSGGLITSEALARGAAMVIIDPIPGQEEWNADYVCSTGAGISLHFPDTVPHAVEALLRAPGRLAQMRAASAAAGYPQAATTVIDTIFRELRTGTHR